MSVQKMQNILEMDLVTMCHKIKSIENVLSVTKEFSLKFNGHMKMFVHLVNSLDDITEDNLILYDEKISQKTDHMHKKLKYIISKEGKEEIYFDNESRSQNDFQEKFKSNNNVFNPTIFKKNNNKFKSSSNNLNNGQNNINSLKDKNKIDLIGLKLGPDQNELSNLNNKKKMKQKGVQAETLSRKSSLINVKVIIKLKENWKSRNE